MTCSHTPITTTLDISTKNTLNMFTYIHYFCIIYVRCISHLSNTNTFEKSTNNTFDMFTYIHYYYIV